MSGARVEVRALVEGVLDAFVPPTTLGVDWRQDPRVSWAMDRPGFSPQAGAWGLRIIDEQAPRERTQAVTVLTWDVLVPLQISPVLDRIDEDAAVDAFADALRSHLFAGREAGESLQFVSASIRSPADGWLLLTVRGTAVYLES